MATKKLVRCLSPILSFVAPYHVTITIPYNPCGRWSTGAFSLMAKDGYYKSEDGESSDRCSVSLWLYSAGYM